MAGGEHATSVSERLPAFSPEERAPRECGCRRSEEEARGQHHPGGGGAARTALVRAGGRSGSTTQVEPDSATYNVPVAYELCGSARRCERWRAASAKSSAVTSRCARPSRWSTGTRCRVDPLVAAAPDSDDLSAPRRGDARGRARRLRGLARRRSTSRGGPLVRVTLLQPRDAEHCSSLAVTPHHRRCVVAGGLLHESPARSTDAFSHGAAVAAPTYCSSPRTSPRGSDAASSSELIQTTARATGEQRRRGAPTVLDLPPDRPRPPARRPRGARWLEFGPGPPEEVTALSQREGVTLFMAPAGSIRRPALPVHRAETTSASGPHRGPHRPTPKGSSAFRQHARAARRPPRRPDVPAGCSGEVRETALEAYAPPGLHSRQLVRRDAPRARRRASRPLFQVMFGFIKTRQGDHRAVCRAGGLLRSAITTWASAVRLRPRVD